MKIPVKTKGSERKLKVRNGKVEAGPEKSHIGLKLAKNAEFYLRFKSSVTMPPEGLPK